MSWELREYPLVGFQIEDREDPSAGEIATVKGRTRDEALSRACVMAEAPELHRALADLIVLATKNLPEHLVEQLKHYNIVLNKASARYERHRQKDRRPIEEGFRASHSTADAAQPTYPGFSK